jgi:hypothetical protein
MLVLSSSWRMGVVAAQSCSIHDEEGCVLLLAAAANKLRASCRKRTHQGSNDTIDL